MHKNTFGFTIVELLIVIVVIAILAAITIVSYTGVQNRANDSVVQSDIAAAAKKLEAYNVDNGRYPSTSAEINTVVGAVSFTAYNDYPNALQYCFNSTNKTIAIGAVSKSGAGFIYKNGSVTKSNGWSSGPNVQVCNTNMSFPMPPGSIAIWRTPSTSTWGSATEAQ